MNHIQAPPGRRRVSRSIPLPQAHLETPPFRVPPRSAQAPWVGPQELSCLSIPSASWPNCCGQLPRRATPSRPPFRPRPSPRCSPAATSSPARRPAPARRPPSRCRCCSCSAARGQGRHPRALVLTPTRELAAQVDESVRDLRPAPAAAQRRHLRRGRHAARRSTGLRRGVRHPGGHDPGRLLDLAGQRAVDLGHVEILVLDEADRMLDMGFIHDIKRVLGPAAQAPPEPALLGHLFRGHPRARRRACCTSPG